MKNCSFFVFSVDDSKYPATVWAKYLSASERSHSILLENGATLINTGFWYFMLTQQFFDTSTLNISQTITPKSINYAVF